MHGQTNIKDARKGGFSTWCIVQHCVLNCVGIKRNVRQSKPAFQNAGTVSLWQTVNT